MRWIGLLLLLPFTVTYAGDSLYCPQNQRYITLGMSSEAVLAACGQPMIKQTKDIVVSKKIPITQLIYSNLNPGSVTPPVNLSSGNIYPGLNPLFNMWSLPSGSFGVNLEIDAEDNKIKSIRVNGGGSNASSLCHGGSFQIGDDINKVYSACGSPSLVNNTFDKEDVPQTDRPERWVYQIDRYQPSISLTFVNGALQSID